MAEAARGQKAGSWAIFRERHYDLTVNHLGRPVRRVATGRWVAIVTLVLAVCCAGMEPAQAGTPRWHRVFSDKFSKLLSSGWTPNWLGSSGQVTAPPNSYELAAMAPRQVSFSKSDLELTSRAQPWTAPDGTTFPYRSAAITGYGKQSYLPPLKAVAKLWLPCSADQRLENWPSFWLVGDPYDWPQDGEIDVVEGLGGVAAWHAHYVDANGVQGPGGAVPGDWCGWHTFAVIWHADGTLDWRYDASWVGQLAGYAATAPVFPVIMYSMATPGSGLAGCPPACSGPVRTGVQLRAAWLHIYRWW